MIESWMWRDRCLLVTVRTPAITHAYLLRHISQEEFIEHFLNQWYSPERPNRTKINEMAVVDISASVYEMLESHYDPIYKMEN